MFSILITLMGCLDLFLNRLCSELTYTGRYCLQGPVKACWLFLLWTQDGTLSLSYSFFSTKV